MSSLNLWYPIPPALLLELACHRPRHLLRTPMSQTPVWYPWPVIYIFEAYVLIVLAALRAILPPPSSQTDQSNEKPSTSSVSPRSSSAAEAGDQDNVSLRSAAGVMSTPFREPPAISLQGTGPYRNPNTSIFTPQQSGKLLVDSLWHRSRLLNNKDRRYGTEPPRS